MKFRFLVPVAALLFATAAFSQTVNGKVKANGDAELHVIRLLADSFPKVSLVFHAQTPSGDPVWNLEQKDVRVEENDQRGRITDFRLLSSDEGLQTMLVIDHSGSMQKDWRYDDWYNSIDPDTLPVDTIRKYYRCGCAYPTDMQPEHTYECPCQLLERDTLYAVKRYPYNWDYRSPLWYAQQNAKTFLRSMHSSKDACGLIGFSDNVDVELPNAADNGATRYAIDGMWADGGTALYDAIDRALNHLVLRRGMRSVVVLTDGADNASRISLKQLIGKAKKMRCPVYVIGLGDVDEYALKQLTEETGGELFLTNDATAMGAVFQRISRSLHAVYSLTYESPFLKSTEPVHQLQLRFDVDSMYLNSQLIGLPLPASVITYLEQREAKQAEFQEQFPLEGQPENEKVEQADSVQSPPPQPGAGNEFPYGPVGITFLAAGAGVLIYRKTRRRETQELLQLLSVFPNPSAGPVTIRYRADNAAAALRVVVLNEQGSEIHAQPLPAEGQEANFDLGDFPGGIYLVRLESVSGVSATERIVIQH